MSCTQLNCSKPAIKEMIWIISPWQRPRFNVCQEHLDELSKDCKSVDMPYHINEIKEGATK